MKKRNHFYFFWRGLLKPFFQLKFHMKYIGVENVPDEGAYILASNHTHAADPIIMGMGLLLSAIVNILIGLSPQMNGFFHLLDNSGKATIGMVYFIGSLWLINGFTQGMGYPPCGSLMAHWIKPSELATKQSIWNSSHSIGAGLVAVLVGTLILGKFGYEAWQWCFFIPAILAAAGSLLLFFGLKDSPASVGLPNPEELDENAPVKKVVKESPEHAKRLYDALLKKMVFRNPIIWILAISNFCVYVIRFTILDWGSMFLTDYKQLPIATAANVVAASEIVGGIIGTLLAGWVTDKFFKSKAHHTCLIFMVMATFCFFMFWKMPQSNTGMAIFFLIMSSFFIYGPQALTGIAASNQATKRAAASANGILGIFGYASTTVSGLAFGMIAKSFGWNTVFAVAIAFGILGCLVFHCRGRGTGSCRTVNILRWKPTRGLPRLTYCVDWTFSCCLLQGRFSTHFLMQILLLPGMA